MNDKVIYDPVELVQNLADQIGIDQLYAIARDLRREPDTAVASDELMQQNEELKAHINHLQERLARDEGMIDGLVFALRCNGVSGAEVRR